MENKVHPNSIQVSNFWNSSSSDSSYYNNLCKCYNGEWEDISIIHTKVTD